MCKVGRSFVAGIAKSRVRLPLLKNDTKWLRAIKLCLLMKQGKSEI